MYCSQCGSNIGNGAVFCPLCGSPTAPQPVPPAYAIPVTMKPADAPSTGFAVLCAFYPLVGLILYLVWQHEYPLKAKSCGKGAIIGLCVQVGLIVILVILYAVLAATLIAGWDTLFNNVYW